jgi:hypothetical protein
MPLSTINEQNLNFEEFRKPKNKNEDIELSLCIDN